jgi:DNA-binding NarL/FixJ family response regulator
MVAALSRVHIDADDARRELRAAVATLVRARPQGVVDRLVVDGHSYVVARVPAASGIDKLSPREKQLIELAAAGFEPKVIAYDLGLAPSTVRVLLARAGRKLGARTWRELVTIYTRATAPATTPSDGEPHAP